MRSASSVPLFVLYDMKGFWKEEQEIKIEDKTIYEYLAYQSLRSATQILAGQQDPAVCEVFA